MAYDINGINSMQQEILHEIALSKIEGVGGVVFKHLLNAFGSAEEVLKASSQKILKVPNVGKSIVEGMKRASEAYIEAEQVLKDCEKLGIRIVSFKNADYPPRLRNLFDAPAILYFKGKGNLDYSRSLAIVGTREATEYGKKSTEEIVSQLEQYNVQIVSGLAYGIDVAAHKSALKHGLSTVGVLANSLDDVYPKSHQKVAREMEETGLLISEQPLYTRTMPQFFVARNRIIAGLADAVIVVESGKKGGSMVTAEYANNYNREVFAIPGGIFQKHSEGPNFLISNNKAQIFTNVEDFVSWMKWDEEQGSFSEKKQKTEIDLAHFSQEESAVLSKLLHNGDMLIDEISWQTGISLNKLASILLNLEFQDLVKQSPGKKFGIK